MTRWVVGMVAVLTACGGGDGGGEVPSCQQAMAHYYASGCAFYDLNTGAPWAEGQAIDWCRQIRGEAPGTCQDDVDSLVYCLDSVPAQSSSNADCDCSQEQEALLTCG